GPSSVRARSASVRCREFWPGANHERAARWHQGGHERMSAYGEIPEDSHRCRDCPNTASTPSAPIAIEGRRELPTSRAGLPGGHEHMIAYARNPRNLLIGRDRPWNPSIHLGPVGCPVSWLARIATHGDARCRMGGQPRERLLRNADESAYCKRWSG